MGYITAILEWITLEERWGKCKGRVALYAKNTTTFSKGEGMSGKFTECFWVIKDPEVSWRSENWVEEVQQSAFELLLDGFKRRAMEEFY